MPRNRALSFGLIAILGACSPASGPGTAAPPAAPAASATSATTDGPVVVPSAPPGLSGRLVFARFLEETHTFTGMFAAAADGSGEVELPMPAGEGGGRWSTTGDLIAVPTQLDDGRIGTAILDPTGTILRELEIESEGLNLACTTWSPDDARLACEGWDDTDPARRGVYTVRSADGGDIQRLTTPPPGMGDDDGDWSPDGTIVFKRYPGDEAPGPLFVVDATGGEPKPLTPGGQEDPGRFSPDGTLVATSTNGVIQVVDLTGKPVSTIEREGDYLFGPAWSPDGAWLVFSRTTSGQFLSDLFIARPDGADSYQVTRTSDNEISVDWGG